MTLDSAFCHRDLQSARNDFYSAFANNGRKDSWVMQGHLSETIKLADEKWQKLLLMTYIELWFFPILTSSEVSVGPG